MSVELDQLLEAMNRAKGDRLESNIGINDGYWAAKQAYQNAWQAAGQTHIPVKENIGVDTVSAAAVAVRRSAENHAKGLSDTAVTLGEAEMKRIIAESELKSAELELEESLKPPQEQKTALELKVEAAKKRLEIAEKEVELKKESHENLKSNPPNVDEIRENAVAKAAPEGNVAIGAIGPIGKTEQEEKDENVIKSEGTAPTPTTFNPLSGQNRTTEEQLAYLESLKK